MLRPAFALGAGSVPALLAAGVSTAAAYGALYRGLMFGARDDRGPIASASSMGPTILTGAAIGAALAIASVTAMDRSKRARSGAAHARRKRVTSGSSR